ncbi:GNAT family N-acetyltransferase [Tepidibacillus marianensis]|uniref:GNAT family N-acetyltransferase n=1 Tax=Tepidibacillus marianensis TaxID=3131995 RepID=UPI0030D222FD
MKEDPDSFLRTYEEEYNLPLDFYENRFKNDWSSGNFFVLGAFANETLVGQVGFKRENKEKVKHKGTLWGMYVVPEARGKGTGKKLIEELIKRTKMIDDLEQINLIVFHTNEPAKKLYRQFGFELFGTEKRSIKINERYLDEDYMVYRIK